MPAARRTRNIFWIIATLLLLSLVVPMVVSLNRWREAIAASLTESLGRPVQIGAVHLTLWGRPGLEIANVIVGEDPGFGIEPFARMESLQATLEVPSFWTGKMRFSSIVFVAPSLNVVRNESGQWNLETFWKQAGPGSPVHSRMDPSPRTVLSALPVIRVKSGRVNFKLGNQKTAYVLEEVDLTLVSSSSPDQPWQLQLEGTPNRTDLPLYPISRIRSYAEFAPSPSSIQLQTGVPLHIDLTAENAVLGDLLNVVLGNDYGMHGTMSFQCHFAGTTSLLRFSGKAEVQNLHRWDLLPPPANSLLQAELEGFLDLAKESLQLTSGAIPLGNGSMGIQWRIEQLLSQPKPTLQLQLQQVSLASVAEIGRQFTNRLDTDFVVQGTLDGNVEITGIPPKLSGSVNVTGGKIEKWGTSQVAQFQDFPVVFAGKIGILGPWKASLGKGELIGSFSWDFEGNTTTRLQGERLPLVEFLQWARTLNSRWGEMQVTGGNLSLQVEVSTTTAHPAQTQGWAEVSETALTFAALGQPIRVQAARLEFQNNQIRARSSAVLGDSDLQGDLMLTPPAQASITSDEFPQWIVEFNGHSNEFDLEELGRLLNPYDRNEPFFWRQQHPDLNLPLLTAVIAHGKLQADRFRYRGIEVKNLDATMTFQDRILEIENFTGEFAGGVHAGKGTIRLEPEVPSFVLETRYADLDLNQLTQFFPPWNGLLSGNVDGVLRLASSGWNWEEILKHLGGSGEIKGENLTLHGIALAETPRFDPGASTPLASLTATYQLSQQAAFLTPLEIIPISQPASQGEIKKQSSWIINGSIGFDNRLNLLVMKRDSGSRYHWAGTLAKPTISETVSQLLR
ncbi:MAG: AsmA family protein [Acidobacteria bacterium]|nr:AsmA family protein [Acidobacteriota bacterium]